MTRVIHTGDTHIGYQQYHSPERREDFLRAFERVVDDAIEDDVDAVVHAGDLFHDRRPGLQDLLGTLSALRRLASADVPFLAIVGNHEGTREGQWLDLFESLGLATRLGEEPRRVGETAFYGLDYVPRSQRDALEYEFADHGAEHAALVAHGLFQPFAHGDWDASEVLEAADVTFDAMLLGDNHAPGTKVVEGTWVIYCGSTERTSAEERDERGYNIVEFGADGADTADGDGGDAGDVRITRRGLPTREFAFVDVELGEDEGVDRVRERLREYDLDGSVVIVTVSGEGQEFAPAGVEEFARERGALVARITDRREREATEEGPEVSFADPDRAVRERVREQGLSAAARDLDETVRSGEVADSNVREAVERRVGELLEEDDAAAFRPADATEETESDATPQSDTEAETGDATAPDPQTEADGGTLEPGEPGNRDGSPADASADGDEDESPSDASADGDEDESPSEATDSQSSMEEYL